MESVASSELDEKQKKKLQWIGGANIFTCSNRVRLDFVTTPDFLGFRFSLSSYGDPPGVGSPLDPPVVSAVPCQAPRKLSREQKKLSLAWKLNSKRVIQFNFMMEKYVYI